MKLPVSLFLIGYLIERSLETFWARKKIGGEIVASYTLYLLVGTYTLMCLTILWEWFIWRPWKVPAWVAFGGITLVLVSLVGRNWAIKTLGPYHSIHIEIRPNHELIQSGPYRFVRNPYYFSNMVEALGLPLVANARLGLLVSIFVYIPLLILRMVLEEKALTTSLGQPFADYKKKVPRILPRFL